LKSYKTTDDRSAKRGLEDIVKLAVLLDLDFKKQKSVFKLSQWLNISSDAQHGYKFDPLDMEEHRGRPPEKSVELVIEPALIKYGNSDGENYHEKTVLVKAQVSCTHLRRDPGGFLTRLLRPVYGTGSKQRSSYRQPRRKG
jgi:hypothetical protein